jgi:peptidoglycan hydrolase CwlO-like protein
MLCSNSRFVRVVVSAVLCTSLISAPFVLSGCTDDKAEQEAHDQAMRDFEEAKERQKQVEEISEQVNQWQEKYEATKDNG